MPLTTSDNAYQPGIGGTGRSKPLCWDCGLPNPVMTVHPGHGYSLCPPCAKKAGVRPAPIEVVTKEESQAEEIEAFMSKNPDISEVVLAVEGADGRQDP